MKSAFIIALAAAASIVCTAMGAAWLALIAWIVATGWSLSVHAWMRPNEREHSQDNS